VCGNERRSKEKHWISGAGFCLAVTALQTHSFCSMHCCIGTASDTQQHEDSTSPTRSRTRSLRLHGLPTSSVTAAVVDSCITCCPRTCLGPGQPCQPQQVGLGATDRKCSSSIGQQQLQMRARPSWPAALGYRSHHSPSNSAARDTVQGAGCVPPTHRPCAVLGATPHAYACLPACCCRCGWWRGLRQQLHGLH
jgi:hypothetical protein